MTFRRLTLSFGLFIALLTHFQVVFACELRDGETPLVCCCDAISESSMGCDMGNGGGCGVSLGSDALGSDALGSNSLATNITSGDSNCCNAFYQHAPGATVVAPDAYTQPRLLLHSPQLLPLTRVFVIVDVYQSIQILRFTSALPSGPTSNRTYRLTNRFRIWSRLVLLFCVYVSACLITGTSRGP